MEHLSSILATVAVTAVTGLFIYVWNSNSKITTLISQASKLPDIENDLKIVRKLEAKVDILYGFWEKEVQAAIAIVHKPHKEAEELDSLLDKFKILMDKFSNQTLSDDELVRLTQLLEEIKNDNSALSGDRLAASRVLHYIEMRYKLMQLGV